MRRPRRDGEGNDEGGYMRVLYEGGPVVRRFMKCIYVRLGCVSEKVYRAFLDLFHVQKQSRSNFLTHIRTLIQEFL